MGLLMAVAAMLTATRWRLPGLYRAGLGLLTGVIAKIFLIDMSGLQGLCSSGRDDNRTYLTSFGLHFCQILPILDLTPVHLQY